MSTIAQILKNPFFPKTPEEQALYEEYMRQNVFWKNETTGSSGITAEEIAVEREPAKQKQVGGDHYSKLAIEPGDYAEANNLSFYQGTAIKYITRYKDKGGIEDLKKAKHCIDKLIEVGWNKTTI